MLIVVIDGLVVCFGFDGVWLGEVVGGVVLKYVCDINLVCEVVLGLWLGYDMLVFDL